MTDTSITTKCCVVGGGPAGMMLGFLLARAGVEVVVLEKHGDFLRDFRGDTVHPSTLELMYELGLLDEFLKEPHQKIEKSALRSAPSSIPMADFSASADALQIHRHDAAVGFSRISWQSTANTTDVRSAYARRGHRPDRRGGRVVGVRAKTPDGALTIRADSGRRLRRPPFDGAREGRLRRGGLRCADGRAVVSHLAPGRRRGRRLRPCRGRRDAGDARPRRLLAMRLCHSERRLRGSEGKGDRRVSRQSLVDVAIPGRARRPAEKLRRRQAADRHGRAAEKVVAARAASASAIPRTRCRRSAASASISRCRTRSPPPTGWRRRSGPAP